MENQTNPHKTTGNDNPRKVLPLTEVIKIILLSVIWLVLLGISFYSYFSIPFLLFISWWIISWIIKLTRGDKHDGSPYDEEY